MKITIENENSIFIATLVGVLLFIAAIGSILANLADIATEQTSYSIAGGLSIPSLILLYKAVKSDQKRKK